MTMNLFQKQGIYLFLDSIILPFYGIYVVLFFS